MANVKHAPRWAAFTVKSDSDIEKAVGIITEANKRIADAIKAGESTSYYSGGESFGSVNTVLDEDDDEQES